MRSKKFASEIFVRKPLKLLLQCERNSHICAIRCQTNDGSTGSACRVRIGLSASVLAARGVPDKQLVKVAAFENQRLPQRAAATESGSQPMPRYYFNTRIGDELIADPDGEELRNPDRAWEIARAMIRELLKTEDAQGPLLSATIEVTDDEGDIVLEFPFAEAILDDSRYRITKH
jgi:hypothetical protein